MSAVLLLALFGSALRADPAEDCQGGDADACVQAGLAAGYGERPDVKAGHAAFVAGCAGDSDVACAFVDLAQMAGELGPGLQAVTRTGAKGREAAVEALSPMCEAGSMRACFHLGMAWDKGFGSASDKGVAVALYEPSRGAGLANACYQLAVIHERGPMAYRDSAQASILYRQACKAAVPDACFAQAQQYASGATPAARKQALELYGEACSAGHGAACHEAGVMWERGEPSDATRAAEFYARACAAGVKSDCT